MNVSRKTRHSKGITAPVDTIKESVKGTTATVVVTVVVMVEPRHRVQVHLRRPLVRQELQAQQTTLPSMLHTMEPVGPTPTLHMADTKTTLPCISNITSSNKQHSRKQRRQELLQDPQVILRHLLPQVVLLLR